MFIDILRHVFSLELCLGLTCGLTLAVTSSSQAFNLPEPAHIVPAHLTYPLTKVNDVGVNGWPTQSAWKRAFQASEFFFDGQMEPADSSTSFCMLEGRERLYVRIRCASRGTKQQPEAVELYITQYGKRALPLIAIRASEDGNFRIGLCLRSTAFLYWPPIYPIGPKVIHRKVTEMDDGWQLEVSLPFEQLHIPRTGFKFNIIHSTSLKSRYAWCDLSKYPNNPSNQFALYGSAELTEKKDTSAEGLSLPAGLKVGHNDLKLKQADSSARLRVGKRVLQPDEHGVFHVTVHQRGPLDLVLLNPEDKMIRSYHANVRRPLLINAVQQYLPSDTKAFKLQVALSTALNTPVELHIICQRDNGKPQRHTVSITPGLHTIELSVPDGGGSWVSITAKGTIPSSNGESPITLEAHHWFVIGETLESLDIYSHDIRSLPTNDMYWKILVNSIPNLLAQQQGSGEYPVAKQRSPVVLWDQMAVYAVALLYKTDRADNPYFNDKRLLQSAIMGMEYALRPEIRREKFGRPDSRSPQAFLMTYALLKNDIAPQRRTYWAQELQRVAEATVERNLDYVKPATSFYSVDCGTGTNHMAYHVSNVYLAGKLFDRKNWMHLASQLMHRLAKHGQYGYFPEQKGSPPDHYTWLTANALSEYYRHSGDKKVVPTLEACARYMTAITTAHGGTVSLFDSRTNFHRPYPYGDYVLSRTSYGRSAAEAKILRIMGNNPSDISPQILFRIAEDALYYLSGNEANVFNRNHVLAFPQGLITRHDGFCYGLSTISRLPAQGRFRLDAQNILAMFHKDAGCILNGGNSQNQPKAGNFFRKLTGASDANQIATASYDYLPNSASVSTIPNGHELVVRYRTFTAYVAIQIISPTHAQIKVAVDNQGNSEPIVFNFFPGVNEDDQAIVGSNNESIHFRNVVIKASRPFNTETEFHIFDPYTSQYTYNYKPVRGWVELNNNRGFVLNIYIHNNVASPTTEDMNKS